MNKLDFIVALAGKENLNEKQAKDIINQIIQDRKLKKGG